MGERRDRLEKALSRRLVESALAGFLYHTVDGFLHLVRHIILVFRGFHFGIHGYQLFEDSAASRGVDGQESTEEASLAARVFATVSRVHW